MDYNHFFRFFSKNNYKPKKNFSLTISKMSSNMLNLLDLSHINISSHPKIDLRNKMPPIMDQGSIGASVANALCCVVDYLNLKLNASRLFLYYNESELEGKHNSEPGSKLQDGITSLINNGICSESLWPYDTLKYMTKPHDDCYKAALDHKVIKANNIHNDIDSMKAALLNGNPFVVGILVYSSFETDMVAKTGIVPMPIGTDILLGGHAVVCVGFDDIKEQFIMRNSWGTAWGDNGHFYVPYAYLASSTLTSDLWCLSKIH